MKNKRTSSQGLQNNNNFYEFNRDIFLLMMKDIKMNDFVNFIANLRKL